MKTSTFDAQITAAVFDNAGAAFALGDGSVRFEGGEFSAAHDGAILCAVAHPSGDGVLTGGDDPSGVGAVVDELHATLQAHQAWPEPETDALVAQLAPHRRSTLTA